MYIGQMQCEVFQYFGMWRPLTWNSQGRILIYRIYSIIMITHYSIFTFSLLIYLIRDSGNIANNMESLFHFSSVFAIWMKMNTMMVKRKSIIDSTDILMEALCQPRDLHELEILQNCSKNCRSNTIILISLYVTSALLILMIPLSKRSNLQLPFKGWIPWSLESRFAYLLTYIHQIVGAITAAFITASVESLAMVVMLQICAQLEIIVHRLHSLPRLQKKNDSQSIIYQRESRIIKECVNHHIYTYMLGEKLNESFGPVVLVQSLASMIGLCVGIYPLSKSSTSICNPRTWTIILPLCSVLSQLYLYCFYGEKLMGNSMAIAEEVYQIDSNKTTIKTKKKLSLIMIRARKPIKFTAFSLIFMTIETFCKTMKLTYTAYNLLKST